MNDFLSLVLPGEGSGWYVAFEINGAGRHHFFLQTLNDLETSLRAIDARGGAAYYATATFTEQQRKITSIAHKRAFYIDVDFKDIDDPDPIAHTLATLKAFCAHHHLPRPTYLVVTGGGIHLYWCLETQIDRQTWLPYAEGLKQAMKVFGFVADHPVTADGARVMRPPGTMNRKYDPPYRVEGQQCGKLVTLEQMGVLLAAPPVIVPAAAQALPMLAVPTPHRQYWIESIIQANSCPMMSRALTAEGQTPDTMPEGLWADLMATCAHAEDGPRYAHEFSRLDPSRYTPETVNAKLASWRGQQHPRTCRRFASHEQCGTCPHQNEATSPIRFGYVSPAPTSAEPMEVVYRLLQSKLQEFYSEEEITVLEHFRPPMRWPAGYGFDPRTFETFSFTSENDPDSGQRRRTNTPCWPGVFWIQQKIRNEAHELVYQFVFWPNKDQRPVTKITSTEMYGSPKEVVKMLMANGFPRMGKSANKAMSFFSELLNLMTDQPEVPMFDSYGWRGATNSLFYMGNYSIGYNDANEPEVRPAIESPFIAKSHMRPSVKGTLEAWKEAVATYEGPERAPYQLVLLSGFASVLMPFTQNKASHIIHFYSDQSGTGKTSVQQAVQSIWADPSALNKGRSTYAAMIDTFSAFGNLPGLVDEITQFRREDLCNLAFDIAAGAARERLRRDGQRLDQRRDWKLIGVTSGNNDIVYQIQSTGNVEGELARLTSLQAPVGKLDRDKIEVFQQSLTNYGYAGREFVRLVMHAGIANMQQRMEAKRNLLISEFCPANPVVISANRFRLDMLSAVLVANDACSHLGLTRFDTAPLQALAGVLLKNAIRLIGEPVVNVTTDIENFIDLHMHEIPKYRRDADDLIFLPRIDAVMNRNVAQSGNMPNAIPRADLFIIINEPITDSSVPSIATLPALYIAQASFQRFNIFPSIRTDPLQAVPQLIEGSGYSFDTVVQCIGGRYANFYRIMLPRSAFAARMPRGNAANESTR